MKNTFGKFTMSLFGGVSLSSLIVIITKTKYDINNRNNNDVLYIPP